ncbi:NYN domain-containing protein [Corynebacterium sp. 3HC-13]|uniref:NYN domain-containing protein n=1 Tax=Corynebacterium poyangense TaxID=2684405 RepID=UPI001CCBFFAD|nr:NYN domain-containing protein [Corynebacterium poyangense]MBZ8176979.1 NYN domain-containing protein [Corynebacterium poyangense]
MKNKKRRAVTRQPGRPTYKDSHFKRTNTSRPIITAILVDGGFYRRRARKLFGDKEPEDRANELVAYCKRHVKESQASLYRIFYYDCLPSDRVIYHPLLKEQVNLGKSEEYAWNTRFLKELVKRRKVALRRGEELETQSGYLLKSGPLKKLCRGDLKVGDLTKEDFFLDITQKGVDMRLGLDIATMAQHGQVNQMVMISGDSDFVPAAKHARRSGIDFILDPLWSRVSDKLNEHVDGVRECVNRPPNNESDPLHANSRHGKTTQEEADEEL